ALVHGRQALIPGMHICHECDTPSCVNPRHLRQDTPQANFGDAIKRNRTTVGEKNPSSKITNEQAREIKAGDESFEHVCAMMLKYRISEATVRSIIRGKSWRHVK